MLYIFGRIAVMSRAYVVLHNCMVFIADLYRLTTVFSVKSVSSHKISEILHKGQRQSPNRNLLFPIPYVWTSLTSKLGSAGLCDVRLFGDQPSQFWQWKQQIWQMKFKTQEKRPWIYKLHLVHFYKPNSCVCKDSARIRRPER
jgi:hypothetical protein